MPSINSIPAQQQELLTDEVQEVISYRPHWMVRKGNLFFLIIVLLLLFLSWLIRYPDKIVSSARLMAVNPPKLISSRIEGKLAKLLTANEQQVEKGQHLGYMESTASYVEIIELMKWVDKAITISASEKFEEIKNHPLPYFTELGEVQNTYQQFQADLTMTRQTFSNGYFDKKRTAIYRDMQYLNSMKKNTKQQMQLQENDKLLQEMEYQAYEKLANEKVIAPLELNQYKSKLLNKDQNLEQLSAQITSSDINSHAKLKEILEIEKQVTDQQQQFRSTLLKLKTELGKWIQQYVLVAPENGTVLYTSTLSENQLIGLGAPLFYLQPNESSYYVELMTAQKGVGKIKKGQQVILRVEGYPSDEFGYLNGNINYIASIPSRTDSFLLKATLPKGLVTNYNKTLFFRNNLSATAEIIADDRRLIERLIGQLRQYKNIE